MNQDPVAHKYNLSWCSPMGEEVKQYFAAGEGGEKLLWEDQTNLPLIQHAYTAGLAQSLHPPKWISALHSL